MQSKTPSRREAFLTDKKGWWTSDLTKCEGVDARRFEKDQWAWCGTKLYIGLHTNFLIMELQAKIKQVTQADSKIY